MRSLNFKIENSHLFTGRDSWPVGKDEDLSEVLQDGVLSAIGTDLEVTISGVTMFLSAWLDPDHWATDWAEKLGVDFDDAPAVVVRLLVEGVESEAE